MCVHDVLQRPSEHLSHCCYCPLMMENLRFTDWGVSKWALHAPWTVTDSWRPRALGQASPRDRRVQLSPNREASHRLIPNRLLPHLLGFVLLLSPSLFPASSALHAKRKPGKIHSDSDTMETHSAFKSGSKCVKHRDRLPCSTAFEGSPLPSKEDSGKSLQTDPQFHQTQDTQSVLTLPLGSH